MTDKQKKSPRYRERFHFLIIPGGLICPPGIFIFFPGLIDCRSNRNFPGEYHLHISEIAFVVKEYIIYPFPVSVLKVIISMKRPCGLHAICIRKLFEDPFFRVFYHLIPPDYAQAIPWKISGSSVTSG